MIKPLLDNIVVELDLEPNITPGGVILPQSEVEMSNWATVVAVGPGQKDGKKRVVVDVNVGDKVLITSYGGQEFTLEGKKYKLVREHDILGVL